MIHYEKFFLAPSNQIGNANLQPRYPIDEAAWIWAPEDPDPNTADFVTFSCELDIDSDEELDLHITADQQFELFVNEERIGRGPDISSVDRWSFASYRLQLPKGSHLFRVWAWHLGADAPMSMMTHRPGFCLSAEGPLHALLSTGEGSWRCRRHRGVRLIRQNSHGLPYAYSGVLETQCEDWFEDSGWCAPSLVRPAIQPTEWGEPAPGWQCFPSTLPPMASIAFKGGAVRHVQEAPLDIHTPVQRSNHRPDFASAWQDLFHEQRPLTVPPRSSVSVAVDLATYVCAYLEIDCSGSKDATVQWEWAESLYTTESGGEKGNRNDIDDKFFRGVGPRFILDSRARSLSSHWWYAGRYCLLTIQTQQQSLTLSRLALEESHYPFRDESAFECDDNSMQDIRTLSERVMQMCAHTTYMDCPYYEQLMYVGDTRLEVLTQYTMTQDDRLSRRAIELFDYSRQKTGFVNERFPSRRAQFSPTFSMIWTWMIRDYLYWRDDLDWVRERAIGVRASLDVLLPYMNSDNLLECPPGWPFCDWVAGWDTGTAPDATSGVSCLVNMHYWRALQCAAEIHQALDEPDLCAYYTKQAERSSLAIRGAFWSEKAGLFSDTVRHDAFSEHVLCQAIIGNLVDPESCSRMFTKAFGAERPEGMAECTVYYKYYLLEAAYRMKRDDVFFDQLCLWRALKANGLKTTVETPEPSRSDCHAWGAHPQHHMHASIAGIRPASPGFKDVTFDPMIGLLTAVHGRVPHPKGWIEYSIDRGDDGNLQQTLHLPDGVNQVRPDRRVRR